GSILRSIMLRAIPVVFTVAALAGSLLPAAETPAEAKATPAAHVLPGVQPGGSVLLPNQWSLRPAGLQLDLGDFPVNMALHPSGRWLAVLHAGYGEHEIIVIETKTRKRLCRVALEQTFYGLCFSPDGRQLFASGGEFEVVHAFNFEDGFLFKHRELAVA